MKMIKACQVGDIETVRRLIACGDDVNAVEGVSSLNNNISKLVLPHFYTFESCTNFDFYTKLFRGFQCTRINASHMGDIPSIIDFILE